MSEIDNILNTTKKLNGISIEDDSFNLDIILYINSVISVLAQLGLPEAEIFPVITESTTWAEFLGTRTDAEMVKTYIGLKTKIMFDPPSGSVAMEALNRTISEQEWRITNLETNKGVIAGV